MKDDSGGLLQFAQQMISLIDSTRHNSTYKFALLMSIIDISAEKCAEPGAAMEIAIREVAHRFVGYYWNQTREFTTSGESIGILRQNQQRGDSILHLVWQLRDRNERNGIKSPEAARERHLPDYSRLIRRIELTIAQQPITHLQTPTGNVDGYNRRTNFLFEPNGFHKKMTRRELTQQNTFRLHPNVPYSLRVLAPLLKPMIQLRWVAVVTELNRAEFDIPDIGKFLFSPARTATLLAAPYLREAQNNRCFYCNYALHEQVNVDHVIPWSRIPLDGIANLVLTHPACNNSKSNTLPVWAHVEHALKRPVQDLETIASRSNIPVLLERTKGAAAGIYSNLPPGTIQWRGVASYELSP